MAREISVRLFADSQENLTKFVELVKREYPNCYFSQPMRNERPPFMNGYRAVGTICVEEGKADE